MRIEEVSANLYRRVSQRAIRNGKYTYTGSGTVLVRVHTDDGVEGIGWTGDIIGPDAVIFEAAKLYGEEAVGLDVYDTEQFWERSYQPKLSGRRGLTVRAMGAIDIAMWDAIGKTAGAPVYKMLGGHRSRVPAYSPGGYYQEGKNLDDLAEEMRKKVEMGARYVKMKIGGAAPKEDEERVRIVRETIGDDIELMVDANNAYLVHEAIQIAHRLEKYRPFWFEEPVHAEDYEGLAKVNAGTSLTIATGENEYTRYGFRDLIECGGADILQPDANILGGITEYRHIASLASSYGLPLAPHGSSILHVHLVAAFSNGLIVEGTGGSGGMFRSNTKLDEDGMLSPPDEPGLGIELNEEYLKEHLVA
ncbi:mandelate racemase/muconate lactonizing enzyme family protein [Candidatus Poribacteria bacterium]